MTSRAALAMTSRAALAMLDFLPERGFHGGAMA